MGARDWNLRVEYLYKEYPHSVNFDEKLPARKKSLYFLCPSVLRFSWLRATCNAFGPVYCGWGCEPLFGRARSRKFRTPIHPDSWGAGGFGQKGVLWGQLSRCPGQRWRSVCSCLINYNTMDYFSLMWCCSSGSSNMPARGKCCAGSRRGLRISGWIMTMLRRICLQAPEPSAVVFPVCVMPPRGVPRRC